jgi:UDP-N-acetylmuramyl tripeptide synthase
LKEFGASKNKFKEDVSQFEEASGRQFLVLVGEAKINENLWHKPQGYSAFLRYPL